VNKEDTPSLAHAPVTPKKKVISAEDFLASFREIPDDFRLMEKYGISPKQLKQVYSDLIEKELLSEFEYNQRERKAPELEEYAPPQLSASTAVTLVEAPSEALTDHVLKSGFSFDPGLAKAVSSAIEDKKRLTRGLKTPDPDKETVG